MKKLYLLLIALVCAVCANADVKTAVFDFASNPWEHELGYGTTSETQNLGNVDQLVADDDETTLACVQGEAGTPARLWQSTPVQFRTYNKSSVVITAPAGITKIKVTATGSSYLFVPAAFIAVEGDTKSKELELDGTEDTYTITINGTTRWTRMEVSYEEEDGPVATVPTFRITCARPTHDNFFAYEGQLCTGLQSSLASYESADNNEWLRFPAEDTDNGYFFYNVGTQQFIGKSTDNIKLPMSTDPTTVYYVWENNQNSDYNFSIGTAPSKASGYILNASSWGAGKDFGARLAPATTCDYDPGNEFQFVETENSITQAEYDAIAKAIHDYYHQPIQLPFELSTAAKTVKYTIVNHHTKGDYYIKTEADGRIRYTQDQNEADRFAFYQGAEEGDGTAYIYDVTTGKYFTWTEDRAASINWGANPPVLDGVYVEAVDSKEDAKVWFFAAEATEGNYDVLPTSKSNNGWNICGGIEDFTVLNLYNKTDNSSSWSFGEAPMLVVNCAKANTLAQGEEARLGAFTVVYVNGSYMYIKDESGFALLYANGYGLKAGDQVAAEPGLVVKSSPFKNLPELVPVTAFADIQASVTEGEAGEFGVATEAPSFANVNNIVKYTGVSVAADVTLAAKGTVNATWGEGTVSFYNQFAIEGTLEAGKTYTIVAANAVYNENLQAYILSVEEEVAGVSVTYTVKFGEQTLKTETITETVGEAPTFALEAPAYVTVSGIPATIEEGTTAVTVETALNEQAPFAVGSTYNFFFHPNGNRYFWKDNGETDAREEFVTTDYVYYNAADAAKYEWTVGGDWMNGFTFVNANGNYINAPEGVAASSRAQLTAEATTKYVLVANGEKWHVAIKGNEGIFLAHVGHNGGNPYLQFWNVADYNGGDLYVTEPLSQTSTKTVTITFQTTNGTKYMLSNNEGTLQTIAYTAEAPASAQFEATLWSNDRYTFTNNGQYVGYRRMDSEFTSALNFWEMVSLEGVTDANITSTVPAGSVYLKVLSRTAGSAQAGTMIIDNNGGFANAATPYFNDTFTSAVFVEEYTAPIVQPINLEKVYLQSKTGQYFALAGGQTTVSEEPYAMTFTAIEGQDNAYSFRNYDNTHWINSGSSGWLSTAPISQTNNIRNYYFYEATITETGVTGTLVEQPVQGKEYMVVVKNINSGNHAGLYALYCGTASSNSERIDVVKITSDNSVIPAEFTLNSENRHDVDIKNSTPGSALEDFQKVVWNIVEPASEPEPKPEFPVEGKAYVVKNVDAQLFLNVIEHETKATVLGTQPEKFFFTKKDGSWVIKNEEGLYVGGHSNTWNMSSSIEQLWKVVEVEGGYAFERADAAGKYIGFNNLTVDPDDATKTAAYRDKSYTANHGVFSIIEYTFPLQGEAYKVKNVDAGYYMHIADLEAKNVTIEKQPQKIFFTVAEEGGYYIQNEEGHYVGAGANDWTVGNTKATWNIVEVEGGYAFQRTDAASKYLGLDSTKESSAYFRNKDASNHYAHLIMLFDTPETTPLEDLQAAIDAAKAIKAEDYATVPEDLFVDLATEIARAEALALQGEDAAVSDINAEIAALEAAVAAITEYTEPSQEELAARLQTALTAARAAVEANYNEETALAGLPGYKPAAVVEALEAAIAQYGETEGELTRDMIVEVEHAVRNYNEAEVCIPEVGKTYLIRNHTAEVGKAQEFSYVITAGAEGLELNSYPDVEKVQNKHLWTVSEKTFTVEDDYGDVIAEETRYVFTNVATGQMFGYTGSTFGLIEGSNEPTMQTSWNYITKTPKEIVSGSQGLTYGTLGLTFDNGSNHNRVLSVDMRTDFLDLKQGDLMQHGLWNTYSSAFIFEVYEPVEDILSFEFADNGDGTYTITPSNNEDTYFACVTSDAINTEYEVESDAGMFEYNTIWITEPETETYKGATTINPVEWINWWFAGYFTPEPGEYRLLAAKIKYVQEYDEEDGKTYEWYEPDGDIATYTFTIQDTEGLGTVLSAEAGKHIFNLKGVRQNTLQRGINIVAGKKVMK